MAWGELDALGWDQIDVRIVGHGRKVSMHRFHDLLIGVWAGHREDSGVHRTDVFGLRAHATGDDDPAVLGQRFADRFQ